MSILRRMAFRFLAAALVLPAMALGPLTAHAAKEITSKWERGNGDPIDGNDFSTGGSGGGGGDIFHRDLAGLYGARGPVVIVVPGLAGTFRVAVSPRFESGLFMVRFHVTNENSAALEEDHVR